MTLNHFLKYNHVKTLQLNDTIFIQFLKIHALLYADGLKYSLNCLARYCEHWKLQVNTSKIEIVIFSKRKSRQSYHFTFNNNKVNIVDSFYYIGFYFNYNGLYHNKFIFGQAQKTLVALLKKSTSCRYPTWIVWLSRFANFSLRLWDMGVWNYLYIRQATP